MNSYFIPSILIQLRIFLKSLQIAFFNFKGHFLKKINISMSLRNHIFRATHAT